jgi:hypothetical protein
MLGFMPPMSPVAMKGHHLMSLRSAVQCSDVLKAHTQVFLHPSLSSFLFINTAPSQKSDTMWWHEVAHTSHDSQNQQLSAIHSTQRTLHSKTGLGSNTQTFKTNT